MKRKRIVFINMIMFLVVLLFVVVYADSRKRDYTAAQTTSFEFNTMALGRITENYLWAEQRMCDSWANSIQAQKMTMEEALDFVRTAIVLEGHSAQLLYLDEDELHGYATVSRSTNGTSNVSYNKTRILTKDSLEHLDSGAINVTRAFTDSVTGLQCIGFYTQVSLQEDDHERAALLLRLIPISELQEKWNFDSGKFASGEVALIDAEGNYIIKDAGFKSNNVFEYIISYNDFDSARIAELKEDIREGMGTFEMNNSRRRPVYVHYTQVETAAAWKIISTVDKSEITGQREDWQMLAFVVLALVLIFAYDLMVINSINRKLKTSMELAEHASRAKTDFLSSMSHDIRTPMNAISGMTAIARKNLDDPERVDDCLRKISLANTHLITLVNDILDISKIESGKVTLESRPFRLHEVLENVVNLVRPQLEARKIRFELNQDTYQDALEGDELRLNQIFINLLSNAIKYTEPEGAVTVTARQTESPLGEDHVRLIWSVSDNGMGMSEDFMKSMYSSFSREQDTRVNKIQGTGLGLAIVKRLVDLMGGDITCVSQLNQGTTFTVTLDLLRSAQLPQESETEQETDADVAGLRILIAEDNDLNWEIISEMLEEYDIVTQRAVNGAECVRMLDAAEENTYDIIFMDIQMPVMNGLVATRTIRKMQDEHKAQIPIIAMTADAFAENIQECLDAGMNSHVSKPIDIRLVLKAIRKVREEQ